jgi:hypothetical protein
LVGLADLAEYGAEMTCETELEGGRMVANMER